MFKSNKYYSIGIQSITTNENSLNAIILTQLTPSINSTLIGQFYVIDVIDIAVMKPNSSTAVAVVSFSEFDHSDNTVT